MKRGWLSAPLVILALASLGTPVAAQGKPYSIDDVATLVSSGVRTARIVELVSSDCLAFVVDDAAEGRLQSAGADAALAGALRAVCYRGSGIEVLSTPAGAEVVVQGRSVGATPVAIPHAAQTGLVIEVRNAYGLRTISADLAPDQLLQIEVELPSDSVSYGATSAPRPPLPIRPAPRGRFRPALFGIGIGAASFGVSMGACKGKELDFREDPELGYSVPNGSGVKEKTSMGCSGGIAAAGLAAGWLASDQLSRRSYNRRVARFEQDSATYVVRLEEWERTNLLINMSGSPQPKVVTLPARRFSSASPGGQ